VDAERGGERAALRAGQNAVPAAPGGQDGGDFVGELTVAEAMEREAGSR
jgi:hypothetical protein